MYLELATIMMCMRHDNRTTYLVEFYSDEHSKHISLLLCEGHHLLVYLPL